MTGQQHHHLTDPSFPLRNSRRRSFPPSPIYDTFPTSNFPSLIYTRVQPQSVPIHIHTRVIVIEHAMSRFKILVRARKGGGGGGGGGGGIPLWEVPAMGDLSC